MDKLIIVDMQNDFIDGTLANPAAKAIVPGICKLIDNFKGKIYATMDTHYLDDYETIESKTLFTHCIFRTHGWNIVDDIDSRIKHNVYTNYLRKSSFACYDYDLDSMDIFPNDTIYIVGTCTEICVISNALALRSFYPENRIVVYSNLCAGLTPESHEAALTVMKNCLIDVKEYVDNEQN